MRCPHTGRVAGLCGAAVFGLAFRMVDERFKRLCA
jgi:hypothetical protein